MNIISAGNSATFTLPANNQLTVESRGGTTVTGPSGLLGTVDGSQTFGAYSVDTVITVAAVGDDCSYGVTEPSNAKLTTSPSGGVAIVGPGGKAYQAGTGITADGYIRMSAVGDSISNRDSAKYWVATGLNGPLQSGIIFNTQMISNGAVRLVGAYAVAGYTTTQIATTVQSNGLTLVQSAVADTSDVVSVLAGTNDTYGKPAPDASDVIFARLRDNIWAPIMAAGKKVLAHTIPPQSPSTPSTAVQRAAVAQVNELIRAYCSANKIMLVDLAAMWRSADGSNQGARTSLLLNESGSYIHPNESGGLVAATERWRVLQANGAKPLPTEGIGLSSPYSIAANPHGVGSNATGANRATISTGVTGTSPDGWSFSRTGTTTAVISPAAVARDDNRDGQSVQVAITFGGAGEKIQVRPVYNDSLYVLSALPSATKEQRGSTALYAAGQCKKFIGNGLWYKALNTGTTGASEPVTPPTAIGSIVSDGSVTWIKIPEITPGSSWIRGVAEVVVTAHDVANFCPYMEIKQYTTAGLGNNLAAGVTFEDDEGTTLTAGNSAASWGSVLGGVPIGNIGYAPGTIPLNTKLYLATPWVQLASDFGVLEPTLALLGGASATATVLINHLDVQIRG